MIKILNPIPRNSLGGRVMYILGLSLLITLIIFSASVFYFVYRTEEDAWLGRQAEAARNAAGTVSSFIRRVQDAMVLVSVVEPDQLVKGPTELEALLTVNPALLEIIRTDSKGKVFASAFKDQQVLGNLITIPQSQWFLKAQNGQSYLGKVQLSATNEPYLIISVPTSRNGVVAARVRMDVLWDVVRDIQFGESGKTIVVTRDGNVIAHTNSEFVINGTTVSGRPEFLAILNAPNNEWSGTYTDFYNERVAAVTTPIPGTDWIMITELPLTEAFATTRLSILALGGAALLIMTLVSFAVSGSVRTLISNPMEQLRNGAERIGQGELKHRIDLVREDEVGQLAAAFNKMAADLEEQQEELQKTVAYEYESKRARELEILLKASEATSSSLNFSTVMQTLASQLLDLSGFEGCFISEWDKNTNMVVGRIDHSKTFWREDKRDVYPLSNYPRTKQVLLTGTPIILQGDFEAEEKQWMDELKRTAVIILPLNFGENTIGLVEIATTKKEKLFGPEVLDACMKILSGAAEWLQEPLPANDPGQLFKVEAALLEATDADVCSFSEWDKPNDRIINTAVFTNISWKKGQGIRFNPNLDLWQEAITQGKTVSLTREDGADVRTVIDGTMPMDAESVIMFPLQKGDELLGMIELYDFNKISHVSPDQVTLLRTIADKASYSIENARLLSQTQKRLNEQTALHNEKEVLLKEIHHRVKNNLQIISSLLNLQSRKITDPQTLEVLRDSQNRVRSMALIHEKLYQSGNLAEIDFSEYAKSLTTSLLRSYQSNRAVIKLKFELDDAVLLPLESAISCGLIVNELVTNTLKYAFPNDKTGTLVLEARKDAANKFTLRVADDGVGYPPDLDIQNTNTLGLQLVRSLVGQLDGKLEMENNNGVEYRISFQA